MAGEIEFPLKCAVVNWSKLPSTFSCYNTGSCSAEMVRGDPHLYCGLLLHWHSEVHSLAASWLEDKDTSNGAPK